jgi:Rho-binding antiterminator
MTEPYRPIACDFHDELCLCAMHQRACAIEYRDESGQPVSVKDRIEDVYTEGKEEFLRLAGGAVVRLDRLISVDGEPLPG